MCQADEKAVETLKALEETVQGLRDIILAPLPNEPPTADYTPSVSVRLNAIESALQFVMNTVKVTITQNSPIIGAGPQAQTMTLLEYYIMHQRQQQMVIKNG